MGRLLRRDRGFHALIVALLGLGIGSATVVFSAVNEVLLERLPVRDPGNLYVIARTQPGELRPDDYFAERHLREAVARNPMFAAAVAEQIPDPRSVVPWRESGSTRLLQAQIVSPTYFAELGVRAHFGRLLEPADASATGAIPAVLSYHFWKSQFGGDAAAVGRTIRLKDVACTVVGILPRAFHSSDVDRAPEIRLPMSAAPRLFGDDPEGVSFRILARLAPGATRAAAAASLLPALRSVEESIELARNARSKNPVPPEQIRKEVESWTVLLQPIERGLSRMRDQFAASLWLLLGGVGLLLLAVCANVAGLLMAKAAARRQEIGIRLAMGATRSRIVRDLLAENVALAIAGAAVGSAFYALVAPRVIRLLPPVRDLAQYTTPQLLTLAPDARVIAFAAAVTLFTVLASGLAPALRSSRLDLVSEIRPAGTRRTRYAGIVPVALQTAFSVVLLAGAGLMARTWWKLDRLDPGFERGRLISFTIDPASAGYPAAQRAGIVEEFRRRVEALPGVRSTAWAWRGIMRGAGIKTTVSPQGVVLPPETFLNTSLNDVTPGYFSTMGMRLVTGRDLRVSDANLQPAPVVVNQALAAHFFPGADPVGRLLVRGRDGTKRPGWVVVGVVNTAKYRSMREPDPPTIYGLFDVAKAGDWQLHLYVRTHGAPDSIAAAVRDTLLQFDPGVPLTEVATMQAEIRQSLWRERLVAILAAFFAVAAATLAAIGLYGALALSVAQRRRELGIRVAVGARARHVVDAVCRPMFLAVACGVVAGVCGSAFLLRLARALLYGIDPFDPVSMTLAVGIVVACAAVASVAPARRAIRVDPAPALREP